MSILVPGRDDVKSPLQSKPANEHAKLENDVIARCRNYCTPDPRHVIRRQNENCSIEIIEARYKISKNCARRRKYSLVPNSGLPDRAANANRYSIRKSLFPQSQIDSLRRRPNPFLSESTAVSCADFDHPLFNDDRTGSRLWFAVSRYTLCFA